MKIMIIILLKNKPNNVAPFIKWNITIRAYTLVQTYLCVIHKLCSSTKTSSHKIKKRDSCYKRRKVFTNHLDVLKLTTAKMDPSPIIPIIPRGPINRPGCS